MNFLKKILKKIAKVSLPIFSFDENELKFQIDSNEMLGYELENLDVKTRHDPYTIEAFTIKNKDILLEHIRLDNDCVWNTDPFGAYKSFFKQKLKTQSMQLIKEKKFDNYVLCTYKIDDEYIIHLIHVFEMYKDTFIVDTKGDLYQKLLNALSNTAKPYEYKNEAKMDIDFDISLTKENAFSYYFHHQMG
jgi:hypothetical protein